eukprot:751371-Hanusia_phi.AAC.4
MIPCFKLAIVCALLVGDNMAARAYMPCSDCLFTVSEEGLLEWSGKCQVKTIVPGLFRGLSICNL